MLTRKGMPYNTDMYNTPKIGLNQKAPMRSSWNYAMGGPMVMPQFGQQQDAKQEWMNALSHLPGIVSGIKNNMPNQQNNTVNTADNSFFMDKDPWAEPGTMIGRNGGSTYAHGGMVSNNTTKFFKNGGSMCMKCGGKSYGNGGKMYKDGGPIDPPGDTAAAKTTLADPYAGYQIFSDEALNAGLTKKGQGYTARPMTSGPMPIVSAPRGDAPKMASGRAEPASSPIDFALTGYASAIPSGIRSGLGKAAFALTNMPFAVLGDAANSQISPITTMGGFGIKKHVWDKSKPYVYKYGEKGYNFVKDNTFRLN
jgi:hypothetical protein